jgi:hypothetical protein
MFFFGKSKDAAKHTWSVFKHTHTHTHVCGCARKTHAGFVGITILSKSIISEKSHSGLFRECGGNFKLLLLLARLASIIYTDCVCIIAEI